MKNIISFSLALTFLIFLCSIETAAYTLYVPDSFERIQWAIDNASTGDKVVVKSGTYQENVIIDKRITLRGWDIGEGMPVVDAGGNGSAITVMEDGVTVTGFIVKNSGNLEDAGFKIFSDDNLFKNNVARDNRYGFYLNSSSNNTITQNTIEYNIRGMSIQNSSINNRIFLNDFINNHNVYSDSINFWNTTEPQEYLYNGYRFANRLGNYWIDYRGEDIDGNGIGDDHYEIGLANRDILPLMTSFKNYLQPEEKVLTPTPISTPTPTPILTTTEVIKTPEATPTAILTSPTITEKTTEEVDISGFGVLSVILGLLISMEILRNRR